MGDVLQIEEGLAMLQGLAPAGFAIALHIKYTTPTYLFQTYPKAWIEVYSRRGFVMRDPTVLWGFDNLGVIDWADLVGNDPEGIMSMARDYGLNNGFTHALEVDGRRTIASFSRSDSAFSSDETDRICAIVDEIHRQTAGLDALPVEMRTKLRRMSILFTHPGPGSD